MLEIITSYTFIIVFLGTIMLAISGSLVGSLNLFKGQSLIGDAIGHSSFPGIIISFMVFQSRNTLVLLTGAALSGALSYYLIQKSSQHPKTSSDSNMVIFLTGFFGLGMVLKSFIQGNPSFSKSSQSGLDNYIFGQASYLLESDLYIIFAILLISLALILLFYKELKVYLFNPEYARVTGVPTKLIDFIILFMTIIVISVGIKAVGSILISSFLIMPTVFALQWTNNFKGSLILGTVMASISAFLGSLISSLGRGLSTGPSIILVSGLLTLFSIIFGKNSSLGKKLMRRRSK
ncbi:MAG: metal ABC transporter permease [Tissierellia bacterium]|nr:metal ABC transporter permease [Tissierellia bacterium]